MPQNRLGRNVTNGRTCSSILVKCCHRVHIGCAPQARVSVYFVCINCGQGRGGSRRTGIWAGFGVPQLSGDIFSGPNCGPNNGPDSGAAHARESPVDRCNPGAPTAGYAETCGHDDIDVFRRRGWAEGRPRHAVVCGEHSATGHLPVMRHTVRGWPANWTSVRWSLPGPVLLVGLLMHTAQDCSV